ncbi:MAG: hypothetical protein SGI77_01240 [Pirellulaceae bacterium]|nr:hypothetical protein [Pirellulaceae bacterium]
MSNDSLSESLLQAFLDDLLPEQQMIEIEQRLRSEPELLERLNSFVANRDQGVHSMGEIWRRHRMSCPTREVLGSYLLGAMMAEQAAYIESHILHVGCRFCQSNLDDLRKLQNADPQTSNMRRQKYFQSSVGKLPPA